MENPSKNFTGGNDGTLEERIALTE